MSGGAPSEPAAASLAIAQADALLFERLVAQRQALDDLEGLGLAPHELGRLLQAIGRQAGRSDPSAVPRGVAPVVSYDDLAFQRAAQALLWQDRVRDTLATWWLSKIIARACLRPDHLWRDLGLQGRHDVSAMLARHFPLLVARNVQDLRWKKFLAQEVARVQGRAASAAPGCPACEDFAQCYPERLR